MHLGRWISCRSTLGQDVSLTVGYSIDACELLDSRKIQSHGEASKIWPGSYKSKPASIGVKRFLIVNGDFNLGMFRNDIWIGLITIGWKILEPENDMRNARSPYLAV